MSPGERDLRDAPACSLLGLAADPRTHFTFPHPAHRCHAERRPTAVDQARQTSQCLTASYTACDRYRAWQLDPEAAPASAEVPPARPPRVAPAPAPAPTIVHVFRNGDSLARIAAAYGLTVDQLVAANHLASPDAVRDGQRLVIPLSRPPGTAPGA